MLPALHEGEPDPQVLARVARGKLRAKRVQLEAALVGQIQEQHGFVLTSQLAHIAFLEEQVAQCDTTIEQCIAQSASTAPAAGEHPMPAAADVAGGDQDQTPLGGPTHVAPVVPAPPSPPLPYAPTPGLVSSVSPAPLTYQQAVCLLDTLPGVNQRIAQIIIADVHFALSLESK